jgi:predicted transcriptional regulator
MARTYVSQYLTNPNAEEGLSIEETAKRVKTLLEDGNWTKGAVDSAVSLSILQDDDSIHSST